MLDYKSRTTDYILGDGDEEDFSFESEYFMAIDDFLTAALAVFVVSNVVTVFIWVIRCIIWNKNNPAIYSPDTYIIWFCGKSLLFLLSTWA